MPKILGLNLLGILAGSVAMFVLGWLWYGMIFMDKWMALMGISPDPSSEMAMAPMIYGFINVVVVTIGIGLVLKWLNVSKLMTALKYGLILCVCFALPTEAYNMIYAGSSAELFLINSSYNLVGYAMVAAIWSFFD
ncbi:MAG: hypothetical protein COA47_01260 [Robiginitomaculum sp.]|nr:MAG: hypothetical protein COA47_01260 [Robiginitomaculum sp.]